MLNADKIHWSVFFLIIFIFPTFLKSTQAACSIQAEVVQLPVSETFRDGERVFVSLVGTVVTPYWKGCDIWRTISPSYLQQLLLLGKYTECR